MTEHLDLLALDAVRAGEASPEEADHAARCAECAAEVEHLRRLAERLAGPRLEVPPAVKTAILAKRPPRRLWVPLSAAAAVLLGAFVFLSLPRHAPEDIDRTGAVDILDAYALAMRLRAGDKLDPRFDFNRDGVVDRKDVDEIARRSVSLSRKGS